MIFGFLMNLIANLEAREVDHCTAVSPDLGNKLGSSQSSIYLPYRARNEWNSCMNLLC